MVHEITFAPTLRCNFRCKHCAVALEDKAGEELSLDEIDMMLDSEIARNADFYITGGEPYMRQDLDDILERVLAHTTGLVKVLTNGYLTERYAKSAQRLSCAKDRLRFSISVDGLQNQHNLIRNNGKSFQKAMESIRQLAGEGYDVHACCIAQPGNLQEVAEMRGVLQAEGVRLSLSPLMEYGRKSRFEENYKSREDTLWQNLNATPANYGYVMTRGRMRIENCHAGIDSLYISPYGEVSECFVRKDFLETLGGSGEGVIGNIREHGPGLDEVYRRFDPDKRASLNCPGCSNESEVIRESLNYDLVIPFEADGYEFFEGPLPSHVNCGDRCHDKLLVSGWSYSEGTHRWMQGKAHVHLRGGGNVLRFGALCAHPDLEKQDVELEIYVDGVMAGVKIFCLEEKGKFVNHLVPIPEEVAGRKIHDIKFVVDRTWESRASGVRRRHGLAFADIGLRDECNGRDEV